ncbi:MAG TPA: alpha/beta hydrolase [Candidatus Dependentiae bacterium]|nr:alpha/beta hydrolase [Candidatus Dependentiae bacterium]
MLLVKKSGVLLLCSMTTLVLLCMNTHIGSNLLTKEKKTMNDLKHQYSQYDVNFENKSDDITLAGTLTVPRSNKPVPAVLLVPGMGPNDRDYTMMGHKLFLVLAEYLTQQGIAVLRYDKRGVGQSTGTYNNMLTSEDFARDAVAGIEYLSNRPDIDHTHIGIIGHSEGGMIAAMVAAQLPSIAFTILLAAPANTSVETILMQVSKQLQADGASDAVIAADRKLRSQLLTIAKEETNAQAAKAHMHAIIKEYLQDLSEEQLLESKKLPFAITPENADGMASMFNSPWYRFFLTYDPTISLRKLTMPVLALNGDHDWVALSNITLPIIEQSLKTAGNKDYTVRETKNMNHWFQTCQTGALVEYGTIQETMSPVVLQIIAQWIKEKIS